MGVFIVSTICLLIFAFAGNANLQVAEYTPIAIIVYAGICAGIYYKIRKDRGE